MEKMEEIVMKNIQERAKEYASKQGDIALSTLYNAVLAIINNAYIAGATEQQSIDEEVRLKKSDDMTNAEYDRETAFADWYLKNGKGTPTYSDAIEWSRKQTIDEVCEWFKTNVGWMSNQLMSILIYELRKAMEE